MQTYLVQANILKINRFSNIFTNAILISHDDYSLVLGTSDVTDVKES